MPLFPIRPRYSLRTLFVVVTLIAGWLGWQVKVVQDRAELLQGMKEQSGDTNAWSYSIDDSQLSWFRTALGDHWLRRIHHPVQASADEVQRVKAAFPEAKVAQWDWTNISEFLRK